MSSDYRKMEVWELGMQIARSVYQFSALLPIEEKYALVSQMRRAAVSIPSNVAEGRMRGTDRDFRQFLLIALGSAAELQTQLQLAIEFYKLESSTAHSLEKSIEEEMKKLNRFIISLSG